MEKNYWKKTESIKLKGTPYSLIGYSIAARNTGFYIPELRVALDCGVPSNHSPEHIFISHCHLDHCGCLPNTIIDMGSIKPNIFVPKSSESQLRNYIHHTFAMTKNTPTPKIHSKYTLIPAVSEDRIMISIKKMPYAIDIIRSFHTVPCVSYGFSEIRTKLKPEYLSILQKDIEAIKLSGVQITDTVEVPQFCFVGDTDERIFGNLILEKFPTIIIECSFLYPEHIKHAKDDKHMHFNNMKEYIISHPDITFVLIHFSSRYTDEEIREFFKDKKLDNMVIWI
jgi:ribonuclease Z